LTGYVPEHLPFTQDAPAPSERALIVGYRARHLPIRYGQLGIEKIEIGKMVKHYCDQFGIKTDIAWVEAARIYGSEWYGFISSCRSMLGSESGSNVFDWDGTINRDIDQYRNDNPRSSESDVYNHIVRPREVDGLMNQVSPRVFEAIASRTVLVLFEGEYSGVIRPEEHYISLKKNGSNLNSIFQLLNDNEYIDAMVDRAWLDIIASGKYSYRAFVGMVDKELERSIDDLRYRIKSLPQRFEEPLTHLTTYPIRANPPRPSTDTIIQTVTGSRGLTDLTKRITFYLWLKLPRSIRFILEPSLKQLLGKG
jgi:hypothetical protein